MKPGTLVMLITHGGLILGPEVPPTGAVGEVIDPAPYAHELNSTVTQVVADFPRHPSNTIDKLWIVNKSWLIPISDPDIDLSEETEDSLNEELLAEH